MADDAVAPAAPTAPPGRDVYQSWIDAGFSSEEAETEKGQRSASMRGAGFSENEIADYWGDGPKQAPGLANQVDYNTKAALAAQPSTSFLGDLNAGFQNGDLGLIFHGKPTVTPRQKPTATSSTLTAVGQAASDLPFTLTGGALGAAAGAETGPGAIATSGAGAMALPEGVRQAVSAAYDHPNGYRTWGEIATDAMQRSWEVAKATAVGALMGPAGAVAGKGGAAVAGAAGLGETATKVAATTAEGLGAATGGTVTSAALNGQVPDASDITAGVVMILGAHVALHGVGVLKRPALTPQGEDMSKILRDVYNRTGVAPWEASQMAAKDPAFRTALFSHDASGQSMAITMLQSQGLHQDPEAGPGPAKTPAGPPEQSDPEHGPRPDPNLTGQSQPLTIGADGRFQFPAPNGQITGDQVDGGGRFVVNGQPAGGSAIDRSVNGDALASLARETLSRGAVLDSKDTVSSDEVQNYARLASQGFTVERNPDAVQEADGSWTAPKYSWTFRVTGLPKVNPDEQLRLVRHLEGSADDAVSPAGAIGRYQIMPNTALQYGFDPMKLKDPVYNEKAARAVLADLTQKYGGDREAVLIAYNAGPGRANAWLRDGRNDALLPVETQRYLERAQRASPAPGAFPTSTPVPPEEVQGLTMSEWRTAIMKKAGSVSNFDDDPEAPAIIGSYLQKYGREAGFRFTIDESHDARTPDKPGDLTSGPSFSSSGNGREDQNGVVNIPNTPDDLNRRWYGLGRYEIIHHEVGHAIDFALSKKLQSGIEDDPRLRAEATATSQNFRPQLWKDQPNYTSKPSELAADNIATYLSDPTMRAKMPRFKALMGKDLEKYLKIANDNLPKKVNGQWQDAPNFKGTASQQAPGNAGGVGQPPAPPPPSPPAVPGAPGGRPSPRVTLTPEMLEDKMLGMVGKDPDPAPWTDRLKGLAQTIDQEVFSELSRAVRHDETHGKGADGVGLEDLLRSTYASKDRAAYVMRHGTMKRADMVEQADGSFKTVHFPKASNESYIGAYKLAKQSGGTEWGFTAYRLAKQQINDAEHGLHEVGSPLELAEAKKLVDAGKEKYEAADAMVNRVKTSVLEYSRDSGMLSQAQVDAMTERHPSHITRRRFDDDEGNPLRFGRGGKFQPRQTIKKMKGSDRKIVEPVMADTEAIYASIAMADRNAAVGGIVGQAEARAAWGLERLEHQPKQEVLDKDGKVVKMQSPDPAEAVAARRVLSGRMKDRDFIFFRDGKPEVWRAADPDIAKMIRGAGSVENGVIVNTARWFAGLQRSGITTMPDYMAKMILRDQTYAPLFAKYGGVPFQNFLLGAFHMVRGSEIYEHFLRAGGMGAALIDMDTNYVRRDVEGVFKTSGALRHVPNSVSDVAQAARLLVERLDAVSRVGLFSRALPKEGALKAGMLARVGYMDFAEGGGSQFVRQWSGTVPFVRPTLLDLRTLTRAMHDRPGQVVAGGLLAITLPSMLLWAWNYLDDQDKQPGDPTRYDNLPQWQRDNFFIFPSVNGERIRIPRSQGVAGLMFGALPTRGLDYMATKDPRYMKGWATNLLQQMYPNTITPLTLPILEQVTNHSMFSGNPLVPDSLQGEAGYMQYFPSTTEPAKQLSRLLGPPHLNWVDVSPLVIENYVRAWTGTLGLDVLKFVDATEHPDRPAMQLSDYPIINSFFVRQWDQQAAPIQDFYDAYDQVKGASAAMRAAVQHGNAWEMAQTTKDPNAFITLQKTADALHNQSSFLQKIKDDPKYTRSEKIQFTNQVFGLMLAEAKNGLTLVDAVNGKTTSQH